MFGILVKEGTGGSAREAPGVREGDGSDGQLADVSSHAREGCRRTISHMAPIKALLVREGEVDGPEAVTEQVNLGVLLRGEFAKVLASAAHVRDHKVALFLGFGSHVFFLSILGLPV